MRYTDEGAQRLIDQLRAMAPAEAAPPLNPPPPSGTFEGMDPWQSSVEKRLDSLDVRSGRLEAAVSEVRVELATVKEKVNHLPTKDWMVKALLGALTVVAALTAFADRIQLLVSRLG